MVMPTILFLLFALLSATGAYLILAHHRGRLAAVCGAVVTLVFFAALFAGVVALLSKAPS